MARENTYLRLVAAASLLLNAVLATVVARQWLTASATPRSHRPSASPARTDAAARHAQPLFAARGAASDAKTWAEALRSVGTPPHLIARLVEVDFEERWETELSSRQGDDQRHGPRLTGYALHRERELALRQEMRTALGEKAFHDWEIEKTLAAINATKLTLTAPEKESIYALQRGLQERFDELEQARQNGALDDAHLARQREQVQNAFGAELARVLGEERFQATHGSDERAALRQQLQPLNPSGAQFEDLLRVQQQWSSTQAELDRQLRERRIESADYDAGIRALDAAREQEYRRVLGNEGYAALEREQDTRYRTMQQNADAWHLDAAQMDNVYRAIRYYETAVLDYERKAQAIGVDGTEADWDAVARNLRQFSQQSAATMRSYVGEERFARMKAAGLFPFAQD